MSDGWIKIHRKMLENPIVTKDADHISVWIYLLLNATHKDYPALFKGERITLKPGQLITGCLQMAKILKLSESKVRRCLNDFKSDGQIDRQTSNKNSLISILNWDLYQASEEQSEGQLTDKWQTTDGQVTTNKNIKNVKNERNISMPPTLEEVKQYCIDRKNNVDPEKFFDFYTCKNWFVGKNKMKDWKAAVRTWERSNRSEPKANNKLMNSREYDFDELEREVLYAGK